MTIFHKIIERQIPADIVYEDELVIAFKDIQPASSVHILIVPKATIPSLVDIQAKDEAVLGRMLACASRLAREMGINESGYRVVVNTGHDGGQTVPQLHLHLLGGREFSWPPG